MSYISLKLESSNKNKKEYWFNNKYGKKPYIKENILYLPEEILNETFISNYKSFPENNKYTNNHNKKKSNEHLLYEDLSQKEPCGLVNIGGTCYMNAVLQCFFHCKPLTEYFLKLDNKKNLGLLSNGYYELVKGLSSGNSKAALKFKEAMMEIDDTFLGNEGKDSKDVAILILTELHNELKENENSLLYGDSNVDPYNKLEVYNEKQNLDEINGNKTIISDIFHFLLLYEQKCSVNCQKYFQPLYTVETDNIIIFELEKIYRDIHKENSNYYRGYRQISLEECLNHYISEEKIKCPCCGTSTLKIRKSFCKLPKIFIFVLSRGINAKFECKINFKKQIDMKNYYNPINKKNNENIIYDLIGATFAYDWYKGFGHTVGFCKSYKKYGKNSLYYVFNDSQPRLTDISEIEGKTPYLLFYERNI